MSAAELVVASAPVAEAAAADIAAEAAATEAAPAAGKQRIAWMVGTIDRTRKSRGSFSEDSMLAEDSMAEPSMWYKDTSTGLDEQSSTWSPVKSGKKTTKLFAGGGSPGDQGGSPLLQKPNLPQPLPQGDGSTAGAPASMEALVTELVADVLAKGEAISMKGIRISLESRLGLEAGALNSEKDEIRRLVAAASPAP